MARLFHYRGDLDAELARIPANILACARAYVAGINARIDEVLADPALLPLEYGILNIRPLKWDIQDLVLIRGISIGNVDDEVRRAQLAAMGLLELDEVIAPLRPEWPLSVPEGLDAAAVSEADLGVLRMAGPPFGSLVPSPEPTSPSASRNEGANAGSNAWTISAGRSATGRPILANDPHLGIGGFGPRHVAHLSAPGFDVIGAGAPGLAGIMQGHTDRFAFGRPTFISTRTICSSWSSIRTIRSFTATRAGGDVSSGSTSPSPCGGRRPRQRRCATPCRARWFPTIPPGAVRPRWRRSSCSRAAAALSR
jgi:penicillin amidase